MSKLTHIDVTGAAHMVDVGDKADTVREAHAEGRIAMKPEVLEAIKANAMKKGDVLATARIAGIMAAKKTADLIPMCHPLLLTHIKVELLPISSLAGAWIDVQSTVRTTGKTGVEMEALTAASVAALTVYDMCKAADRAMTITDLRLVHKHGGKSGGWNLEEDDE